MEAKKYLEVSKIISKFFFFYFHNKIGQSHGSGCTKEQRKIGKRKLSRYVS